MSDNMEKRAQEIEAELNERFLEPANNSNALELLKEAVQEYVELKIEHEDV